VIYGGVMIGGCSVTLGPVAAFIGSKGGRLVAVIHVW
jgi:hypothetical protein